MKCKRCLEKEKTWGEGNSEIECAFESGTFSESNWNCGTMDTFREIAEKNEVYNDDMYAGVVPLEDGKFFYLEWYKSSGITDKFINMDTLENVTLKEAEKAIETFS